MGSILRHLRENRALLLAVALFAAVLATWVAVDRPVKEEKKLARLLEAKNSASWRAYVPVYLWRGLTVDVGLAALLVAACAVAGRRLAQSGAEEERSTGLGTKLLVGGCVLVAALQTVPRLSFSTWGDEDYTVKTYVNDQFVTAPDGTHTLERVPWANVLWHYKRPNNHVGYTAVARAVHDAFFRPGTGPTDPIFSETLVRLPAFAFGLLSVLTVAWMARVWGWTRGLWLVLPFYVLHPWLIRFGSEVRGYAVVLATVPLLVGLVGRALQTGAWRWWLGMALVQTYLFWAYWGVVYVLVCLHAALVLLCLTHPARAWAERRVLLARWLVACLLPAMVISVLMAPNLPQFLEFMRDNKQLAGGMDAVWWQDAWGYLVSGTPWHAWDASAPHCVALAQMGPVGRAVALAAGGGLLAVAALGAWRLWRGGYTRWLLLPFAGAPVLFIAHMTLSGVRPYHWYLSLFLPGFLALLLAGVAPVLDAFAAWWRRRPAERPAPAVPGAPAVLLLTVAAVCVLGTPQRLMIVRHPLEPCRESVALTRQVTNPRHPDFGRGSMTGGFTMFTEAYDPAMIRFQTADELRALMAQARETGRDFFVNFSSRHFCEQNYPDLFAIFNDPEQFELVAVLPGGFDAGTREVIRMK